MVKVVTEAAQNRCGVSTVFDTQYICSLLNYSASFSHAVGVIMTKVHFPSATRHSSSDILIALKVLPSTRPTELSELLHARILLQYLVHLVISLLRLTGNKAPKGSRAWGSLKELLAGHEEKRLAEPVLKSTDFSHHGQPIISPTVRFLARSSEVTV